MSYNPFGRKSLNNRKTTRGRKKQIIPIIEEKEINHEWVDKSGKIHNRGVKSIQRKVRTKVIEHT